MKSNKQTTHSKTFDVLDELLDQVSEIEKNRTEIRMRIAANIDDLIRIKKWKKQLLAEKLNKLPSEISKWLSGTHNFTSDTLADIAFVFGVEINELVSSRISDIVYDFHYEAPVDTYARFEIYPQHHDNHLVLREAAGHFGASLKSNTHLLAKASATSDIVASYITLGTRSGSIPNKHGDLIKKYTQKKDLK